jgi:redox-sensitive bicupin YhaK (pirin superfamily)
VTTTEAREELELCPGDTGSDDVQVLRPRDVPLGGPRAMTVRRTLPHRERSFVGAWCFVDHYGPDDTSGAGMDVPPHPHTGLQTVSWLFAGEVEHRDSAGAHALIRPGEVNLMTAGHGIAHSEVSTAATGTLHGVQLWVVLPGADRGVDRALEHHAPPLVGLLPGVRGRVFLGSLAGHTSPVGTFTPLLGAELHLEPGRHVLPVDPAHEHAVLVDTGVVDLQGTTLAHGDLGIVDDGRAELVLVANAPSRVLLLGGEPFEEEVVMWWNFIAGSHEEIAAIRQQWQERSARFGEVPGYTGSTPRLDAPALPNARLRARGRTGRAR